MIAFRWKGCNVTATLTPGGWQQGPCDCDLSAFTKEADAAARLAGIVLDPNPAPPAGGN
jgi:hypothetical protein